MSFQTDGNATLDQQQLQLRALETFFLEVIDFQAADNNRNNVTTADVEAPLEHKLSLRVVADSAALAEIAAAAHSIVFDRQAFVAGQKLRVVGFRT
jgi:predicted metal-dependent HD superfamily phosphohydrolase